MEAIALEPRGKGAPLSIGPRDYWKAWADAYARRRPRGMAEAWSSGEFGRLLRIVAMEPSTRCFEKLG